MRKLIPFILLIVLFSCEKEVSEMQADYFIKFYGTELHDIAGDVCELPDGGYAIVGTSETEERGTDISLIITDKFGRQVGETKYFENDGDDKGNGLYIYDEGMLISGAMEKDGSLDAVLIQTDFAGNTVGEIHTYGGANNDEAFASVKADNGGFKFVGYTEDDQYYIVSLDENFDTTTVTGNDDSYPIVQKKILKYRDNQYFSAGTRIFNGSTNTSQICILDINKVGRIARTEYFGDQANRNEFAAMVQQNDSTLFVLSTLKEGNANEKLNLRKIVAKFDPVNPGEIDKLMERASYVFSDGDGLAANSLCLKDDGSFVILATKTSGENMVLLFIDEDGNQIGETKEFGGPGNQSGSSVICSDGAILILGNNTDEVGDNTMITLIKTDNQGNLWE